MGDTDILWLGVTDIQVTDEDAPSQADIGKAVQAMRRQTEATTTLVVRRVDGDPPGSAYQLVTGRRQYEASCQLGRTQVPCRIVPLTDDEARSLRRLDVLMAPRAANDLIRGWALHEAVARHDWDRDNLRSLLPNDRKRFYDAWNPGEKIPREPVVAACRAHDCLDAPAALKRKHIRELIKLPEDAQPHALTAHATASDDAPSPLEPDPVEPTVAELLAGLDTAVDALVDGLERSTDSSGQQDDEPGAPDVDPTSIRQLRAAAGQLNELLASLNGSAPSGTTEPDEKDAADSGATIPERVAWLKQQLQQRPWSERLGWVGRLASVLFRRQRPPASANVRAADAAPAGMRENIVAEAR